MSVHDLTRFVVKHFHNLVETVGLFVFPFRWNSLFAVASSECIPTDKKSIFLDEFQQMFTFLFELPVEKCVFSIVPTRREIIEIVKVGWMEGTRGHIEIIYKCYASVRRQDLLELFEQFSVGNFIVVDFLLNEETNKCRKCRETTGYGFPEWMSSKPDE